MCGAHLAFRDSCSGRRALFSLPALFGLCSRLLPESLRWRPQCSLASSPSIFSFFRAAWRLARPLGRFGGTSRSGKGPSRFCGGNRRVPALAFTLLVAGTQHDSGCMESPAKTHNVRGARARRWSRSRHRRIQDRPGRSTGVSRSNSQYQRIRRRDGATAGASTMTPNPLGSMSRPSSSILGWNTSANTVDLQLLTGPLK